MSEVFKSEFRAALAQKAPDDELVGIISRHRDAGVSQREAYDALRALRTEPLGEEDEDRILEMMDLVSGYCPPKQRLWNDQLA